MVRGMEEFIELANFSRVGGLPGLIEMGDFFINLVRMFAWADSRDQSLH